jgi:hypothetical protein
MAFFEPPPPDPEIERERRWRAPPWMGAPDGVLAGVAPVEVVLARSDMAAVCVEGIAAYPEGFVVRVVAIVAEADGELPLEPMHFHPHHRRRRGGGRATGLELDFLRFGIQFSDGGKATNLGGGMGRHAPRGPDDPPEYMSVWSQYARMRCISRPIPSRKARHPQAQRPTPPTPQP